MNELEILDAIGHGKEEFSRDEFPELDEIDRHLRRFAQLGYLEKVVRAIYPVPDTGRRLMRVDVVGGLTLLGEGRRKQLLASGTPISQQLPSEAEPQTFGSGLFSSDSSLHFGAHSPPPRF